MATNTTGHGTGWMRIVMAILSAEKIIQHAVVTAALTFNWKDIRTTVAVSPNVLIVAGAVVAILFAVALWALLRHAAWATGLVMALAIFDMVGEFIAQGRLAINLNVSFLVATILLILALMYRRPAGASAG